MLWNGSVWGKKNLIEWSYSAQCFWNSVLVMTKRNFVRYLSSRWTDSIVELIQTGSQLQHGQMSEFLIWNISSFLFEIYFNCISGQESFWKAWPIVYSKLGEIQYHVRSPFSTLTTRGRDWAETEHICRPFYYTKDRMSKSVFHRGNMCSQGDWASWIPSRWPDWPICLWFFPCAWFWSSDKELACLWVTFPLCIDWQICTAQMMNSNPSTTLSQCSPKVRCALAVTASWLRMEDLFGLRPRPQCFTTRRPLSLNLWCASTLSSGA